MSRPCHAPLAAIVALLLAIGSQACAPPRWPVHGRVTSPFGLRRDGWRLGIHRGIDIAVPEGTPIRAMAAGRVAFSGTLTGYGRVVILEHGPNLRTLYAHLSELRVATGEPVSAGAPIGLSGSTGRASGPHLHFEILRRGHAEDPVPLLGGAPPS